MRARQVLLKPLVTERTTKLRDENNKYAFEVDHRANKMEIKNAVEEIFGVHVVSVRTMNVLGKLKRLGRSEGRQPSWKKAIVTLREGDTIEAFDRV